MTERGDQSWIATHHCDHALTFHEVFVQPARALRQQGKLLYCAHLQLTILDFPSRWLEPIDYGHYPSDHRSMRSGTNVQLLERDDSESSSDPRDQSDAHRRGFP